MKQGEKQERREKKKNDTVTHLNYFDLYLYYVSHDSHQHKLNFLYNLSNQITEPMDLTGTDWRLSRTMG